MSVISGNPSADLPNHEKIITANCFIERKKGLYIQKGDKETDLEK